MTRRVGTVLLVVTTAVAVVLVGAPAHADTGARTARIIEAAYESYTAVQRVGGDPARLEEATSAIIDAADQVRRELLSEIDDPAAAAVRACTDSTLTGVETIRAMTSTYLEAFVSHAMACVNTAKNIIDSIGRHHVVNQVAFALNMVGPVALVGRARQRLATDLLRQQIVTANQANLARLTPECTTVPVLDDNRTSGWVITCTSFAGATGQSKVDGATQPADYTTARLAAMRSTSYGESLGLLPILTEIPGTG